MGAQVITETPSYQELNGQVDGIPLRRQGGTAELGRGPTNAVTPEEIEATQYLRLFLAFSTNFVLAYKGMGELSSDLGPRNSGKLIREPEVARGEIIWRWVILC